MQVNPGGTRQPGKSFDHIGPRKGKLYTLIIPFRNVEIILDTSKVGHAAIIGTGKQKIPGKHGMVMAQEVQYHWPDNNTANALKWVDIKILANEREEV